MKRVRTASASASAHNGPGKAEAGAGAGAGGNAGASASASATAAAGGASAVSVEDAAALLHAPERYPFMHGSELVSVAVAAFVESGVVKALRLDVAVLKKFLMEVRRHYRTVYYHK